MFSGYYIKFLTDSTLKGNLPPLVKTGLLILTMVTLGVLSKYWVGVSAGRFSFYIIRDIRNKITDQIERMKVSYLEARHSGQIVAKLTNDVNVIQGFLQNSFPPFLYNTLVFTLTFIYLSTLNWKLLLTAIASVPISMFLINLISKPIGNYARIEQESTEDMSAVTQDAVGGVYIEKAYNLTGIMQHKLNMQTLFMY